LLRWYGGLAPAQLAKLSVPLMCINSDKQPTDEAAMLALRPDFQARYMPGTGHFLFREDPATFNKLLRETIAEMMPK
jgi:pimeloyl-ACP methyl ester carboxylesterase